MASDGLWTPDQGSVRLSAEAEVHRRLSRGSTGVESDEVREMRLNRQAAANNAERGGTLEIAAGRPRDPMFYWEQNNLPYKIDNEEELSKIRKFCNTPDAPVWMGDYSFKEIGQIVEGDEVIGWEWYQAGSKMKSRLARTPVLAVSRRMAPEIVRVTMESGRVIRCTPDHEWANPLYSPAAKVRRPGDRWTDEYLPVGVGRYLRHVIDPTPELASEKDRLMAAWLGGLYDGEGTAERIAQDQAHNPEVCQRIEQTLDHLGLPWTRNQSTYAIRNAGGAKGGTKARQHVANLLNWGGVTRRQTTALDKLFLTSNFGSKDRVVSIESEGPGEVVSMQTGTGNYTAWGFASKNCRLLYLTHPVVASAIDIYSKYPLTGMELICKDKAVAEFYEELLFDQLDYEEFMVDVLREYWLVGEAFPFGSFNDSLGVWEDDELMNPDDVRVIKSAFHREPRYEMKLPETLRNIINKREPKWEYEALMAAYPEIRYYQAEDAYMPVSGILLQHLPFRAHAFHPRGIPILLRGMRSLGQEEMLNAAQDAVASRLYTPLFLAKLGASASDLGTATAWVPTENDLQEFNQKLDAALAADFRVLTTNFAANIEAVFGKENFPDFNDDFDRLTERILQVFGMSKTMLSGGDAGETYAADAMNRDLVSQLLSGAQRKAKRFIEKRMLVVAEAQEHWDYEVRGGQRYPIMEEILEINPETGEQKIVEQPKLLVPDLKIKAMDIRRDEELRTFIEAAVAAGVPVSQKTRFVNIPIDLEEERKAVIDERVDNAVAEQEARQQTYQALKSRRLPIPEDLLNDFGAKAAQDPGSNPAEPAATAKPGPTLPTLDPSAPVPALVPTEQNIAEDAKADGEVAPSSAMPRNQLLNEGRTRPPESDEMRKGMPVAAALAGWGEVHPLIYGSDEPVGEDEDAPVTLRGESGEVLDESGRPVIGTITHGPRHVGMRRYSVVRKDKPLNDPVSPPDSPM